MVNVTHLRALAEVVRTGSFAAAGRSLGYTSSAISQQIAALERSVGVTLFEREMRGIRATPAAQFAADHAGDLVTRMDDFDALLTRLAGGSQGRLRLSGFPTANSRIMAPAIADIVTSHPAAEVELDEGNTGRLVEGVVSGQVDVAVVHVYALVPERWPAGLTLVELTDEELLLLLPADHDLVTADPTRLDALRNERWISSHGTAAGTCLLRICSTYGFVPTVAFRSDDYSVVQGLVGDGVGVAIAPEMAYSPDPNVHCVPLIRWSPGRRIFAMHRTSNTNPLLGEGLAALKRACGGS